MTEVIGIVSSVVELVDSTANYIDEFTRRCYNFVDSPDKIENTSYDCEYVRDELQKLHEGLREERIKVKDDLQADFLAQIVNIELGFNAAREHVEELKLGFPNERPTSIAARLERVKITIKQLFCVDTYAARIDALADDIAYAKTAVSRLIDFVHISHRLRATTEDDFEVGDNVEDVADNSSNAGEDVANVDVGISGPCSDVCNGTADIACIEQNMQTGFNGLSDNPRAKFEVPFLPSDLVLDFDTCEQGEPLTTEGKLKRSLMNMGRTSDEPGAVIITFCAQGMGGVGKTSALIGLGWDPEVRESFKEGGIYFISVGRGARSELVIKELERIVRASGGHKSSRDISETANVRDAVEITVTFFEGRRTLFLCDDVWETGSSGTGYLTELKQLLATHISSRMVISTGSKRIASMDGGIPVMFESLAPEGDRSLDILLSCSPVISKQDIDQSSDECRHSVSQVLSICAGVPLALAIAGKAILMIAQHEDYQWLQAMVKYAQDLESSIGNIIMGEINGYPNFVAIVSASLQVADRWAEKQELQIQEGEALRCSQLFTALAVLRSQAQASHAMLSKLWGLSESSLVHEIVGKLADLKLVTAGTRTGTEHAIGLHGLVLEYCQLQAGDRLGQYHRDLLDEYFRSDSDIITLEPVTGAGCINLQPGDGEVALRTWWNASDDYIQENVSHHLAMAACTAELVALLSHGRWTDFRTNYGRLLEWESDFQDTFACLEKISGSGSFEHKTKNVIEGLKLIRDAVKDAWVFIRENPRELAFQMYARLCDAPSEMWNVTNYLDSANIIADKPWLKPKRRYLPLPGRATGTDIFREGSVSSISITNDMALAAVAVGCEVLVCNVDTRTICQRLQKHEREIVSVAISQHGTRLASVSNDGTLLLWNRRSKATFSEPVQLSEEGQLSCVAMTKDGSIILAGSQDGNVKLWDGESGSTMMELRHHDGPVTAVAVSQNGRHIASSSEDGTVRLWDGVSGKQKCTLFHDSDSVVSCVAISADGLRVVSGSYDNTIQLWDGKNGTLLHEPLRGHVARVRCVAMTSDGTRVVSGADDATLRAWDVRNGQPVGMLRKHEGRVSAVAISADGLSIVSGSSDNSIRLWNLEKETAVRERRKGHRDSVLCVTVSADGSRIASGSKDKTVRLWNSENGEAVCGPLRGHDAPVMCVAFCADGSRVLSGSCDRTVRIWDWESRRDVGEPLLGHEGSATCVAASGHCKYVVAGSQTGTVRLWSQDVGDTGVANVVLQGHQKWVSCVAISPDGSTIVSGSRDRTIRLWQLSSQSTVGSPVTFNACSVWMRDGFVFARHRSFCEDQLGTKCWRVDNEQGLVRCDGDCSPSSAVDGDSEERETDSASSMISRSDDDPTSSRSASDESLLSASTVSHGINLAERYSFISCFQQFVIGGRTTSADGYILSTLPTSLGASIVEQDAWVFHPTEENGRSGIVVVGLRDGTVCILELMAS